MVRGRNDLVFAEVQQVVINLNLILSSQKLIYTRENLKQPKSNLVYMYKFQLRNNLFCGMAQVCGTDEKVNISEIAKQTTVPVATLWKWIQDKVRGTGHMSGGPRRPKVLMTGKSLFRLILFFCLNSLRFNWKIKITIHVHVDLFFSKNIGWRWVDQNDPKIPESWFLTDSVQGAQSVIPVCRIKWD